MYFLSTFICMCILYMHVFSRHLSRYMRSVSTLLQVSEGQRHICVLLLPLVLRTRPDLWSALNKLSGISKCIDIHPYCSLIYQRNLLGLTKPSLHHSGNATDRRRGLVSPPSPSPLHPEHISFLVS